MGKIAYQLTTKEYVNVLRRRRWSSAYHWLPIGLIVLGLLPLAFVNDVPRAHQQGIYREGYYVAGIGIFLLVFPILIRHSILSKAVRNNPMLTDPTEATFDDQGIAFTLPNRKSQVTWTVFVKLTQDANYFYLHTNKTGAVFPLPKRAFDATNLQEFERCSRLVPRM